MRRLRKNEELRFTTYLNVTAFCAASVVGAIALHLVWDTPSVQLVAYCWVVGMASFWAAGLIGFLFGVPIESTSPRNVRKTSLDSDDTGAEERRGLGSTRLAEVADWLTKIVIGVSLVEIRALIGFLIDAGEFFGDATSVAGDAPLFTAVIVASAATGFWFLYFWSWMYWPRLQAKMQFQAEVLADTGVVPPQGAAEGEAIPPSGGGSTESGQDKRAP